MAVTATFAPGARLLSVFADSLANTVPVGRNAVGAILVNNGAAPVLGGTPTVANTDLIQAFGLNAGDLLALDEAGGALPRAVLFGGSGNDTVAGGSGADQLFGQADDDALLGRLGADVLFGGDGDDTLTGGDAGDQIFGEGGHDRMIWNLGDDSDLMEGGAGNDTAEVNGGDGAGAFAVAANGARVRLDRVDISPFSIDIGTTETIVLNAGGGGDSISAVGSLTDLTRLTIDAAAGNDIVGGGNGADVLLGGDGNDRVDGSQGDDVAFLGAGDDVFAWDPGDGGDVVEGQAGSDRMDFRGDDAGETMDISALGGRVRVFRDVDGVSMDLNDVERIDLQAFGGQDAFRIGDLSGTDLREVRIDLGAAGWRQPRPRGHGRRQRDVRRRRGRGPGRRRDRDGHGPRGVGDDQGLRRRRPARGRRDRRRRRRGGRGGARARRPAAHRQRRGRQRRADRRPRRGRAERRRGRRRAGRRPRPGRAGRRGGPQHRHPVTRRRRLPGPAPAW